MNLKLFQTTCKLSEADKLNDALTRNEWQNKKKKNLLKFAAEIISAQTAIIGGNLSPTIHRDTTMARQPSTHPSRYKIEL